MRLVTTNNDSNESLLYSCYFTMAEQFIGLHMRVVLRDPPGYLITGTVRAVEAGNSLTLNDGKCSTVAC